jgi:hypothetical protein
LRRIALIMASPDNPIVTAQPQGADMLDPKALRDYGNWVGKTAWEVYGSVIAVGGWQHVFPGALPRWASRVRQYFNLTPMTLKLLDHEKSSRYLEVAQTALPASNRAKARRNELQSRGMGISFYAPGSSTAPGTPLVKPDPNAIIETRGGDIGTMLALSGDVYEDALGRSIWFQMSPGGAIYHFGEKIRSPTLRAIEATLDGQIYAPVFKLVCLDGTGGSREVCIKNSFNVPPKHMTRVGGEFTTMVGHATIGAVNEEVKVANRIVKDSVSQGSYNYAETIVKGLPAHQRLDVNTDPMTPGYYVEPLNLFQFAELYMRRFPENDREGKPLAAQTGPAP